MRIETIKVYKGSKDVTIDKTDEALAEWNDRGFYTSSQRQKTKKKGSKKGEAEDNDETDVDPEIDDVQGEYPEDNESLEGEELDSDIEV